MGRINQNIDDKLEADFRETARAKFGDKKGSLKEAFEEAVKMWLAANKPLLDKKNKLVT
jgi:hypothetical protein